jgi:hypothetical protein
MAADVAGAARDENGHVNPDAPRANAKSTRELQVSLRNSCVKDAIGALQPVNPRRALYRHLRCMGKRKPLALSGTYNDKTNP